MAYHLFIQSLTPAIAPINLLLENHEPIQQIFFYFQGIQQLSDMTFAKEWDKLVKLEIALKVCKTTWEDKNHPTLPAGFVLSSLIEFFAEHWQDQGILLQL